MKKFIFVFSFILFTFSFFNIVSVSAFTITPSSIKYSCANTSNVTWTNPLGVTVSGNSLQKMNRSDLAWNAGAISSQSVTSGDACVEFTAVETDSSRVAGLGNTDVDQNYTDIEYGIQLKANTYAQVWQSGVNVCANCTTYVAGDVFMVAVHSGLVSYYKNGSIFHELSITPTYPLYLDTSLYGLTWPIPLGSETRISNAKIGTSLTSTNPLSISTASPLASGKAGTPYSSSVTATGGIETYNWSVISGSLPLGISLATGNCITAPCQLPATLSGTPTRAGTYTFSLQASTVSGQSVSRQFTLVIDDISNPTFDMNSIKSITYYTKQQKLGCDSTLIDDLSTKISGMKDAGFNTVWLVSFWKCFSPVAYPNATYDEQAFARLRDVLALLKQNGMKAILPLNYFDFIPGTGIDSCNAATYKDAQGNLAGYIAFKNYVEKYLTEILGYNNDVAVIIFTENMACGAYENPPVNTAPIIRNTMGRLPLDLDPAIRSKFKIGFHDFLFRWSEPATFVSQYAVTPVPFPYDFYSFAHYVLDSQTQADVANINNYIARLKSLYGQNLTVFNGELGVSYCVYGEAQQASLLTQLLQIPLTNRNGFNVWGWLGHDCKPGDPEGYFLNDKLGNPLASFYAVKNLLNPSATPSLPVISPTAGNVSNTISIGKRVKVVVSKLNVRQKAGASSLILGTERNGALGTVTEGPTTDKSGLTWWKVQFNDGLSGWAANSIPPNYNLALVLAIGDKSEPAYVVFNESNTTTKIITKPLYKGLSGDEVVKLQDFLISKGLLASGLSTGYMGALTKAAVMKYQCQNNIVCKGNELTTGYGFVGVKTRGLINSEIQ